ncbi:Caveolin-2 [Saguinus oedipus]|uniref:Caveolin-2 n=1 Tax=Saguinus oedipus TaxID=9490 RepID=A0ABQ9UHE8_SAGOE|nr:Caveolin-2 [Saguinus oedipus]
MGLETEKADVQLFMDDDSYSHHSGLEYADPEKFADSGQDRDPHRLNSHLKAQVRAPLSPAPPSPPYPYPFQVPATTGPPA